MLLSETVFWVWIKKKKIHGFSKIDPKMTSKQKMVIFEQCFWRFFVGLFMISSLCPPNFILVRVGRHLFQNGHFEPNWQSDRVFSGIASLDFFMHLLMTCQSIFILLSETGFRCRMFKTLLPAVSAKCKFGVWVYMVPISVLSGLPNIKFWIPSICFLCVLAGCIGLSELIHDNLTESKRTINLLQRMNIYQEVLLSILYRLLPIQVTDSCTFLRSRKKTKKQWSKIE